MNESPKLPGGLHNVGGFSNPNSPWHVPPPEKASEQPTTPVQPADSSSLGEVKN